MAAIVLTICLLLDGAFWLLLLMFCVSTYRAYKLQSLPWLGAYAAVSLITSPIRQYLTSQFLDGSKVQPLYYGQVSMTAEIGVVYLAWLLISLSELCALVLVLAEIASLIGRSVPEVGSAIMKWFCAVHTRVRLVGTIAVASSLLSPVPALLYLLAR